MKNLKETSNDEKLLELIQTHLVTGNRFKEEKNYGEAFKAYNECLSLDPCNATAIFYLGFCQYKLKHYNEALQTFDNYLKLHPKHLDAPQVYLYIARTHHKLNKFTLARDKCKMGLKIDPKNPWLNLQFAKALASRDQNNNNDIIKPLELYLEAFPQDAKSHLMMGIVCRSQSARNDKKAIEAFITCVSIDPNNYIAYGHLGEIYEGQVFHRDMGRPSAEIHANKQGHRQAIVYYQKSLAIMPFNAEFLRRVAKLLHLHGRYLEAIESLQRYIKMGHADYDSYLVVAECFSNLQRFEEAIEYFDKCLKVSDDYERFKPYFNKGKCLYQLKRYQEAATAFGECFKIKYKGENLMSGGKLVKTNDKCPDYVNIDIARCYFNLEKFSEALKYCKIYYDASKFNRTADAHFLYAQCLQKTERYDLAIRYAKAVLSLPKYFADASLLSASCWIAQKKYAEASSILNNYLSSGQDNVEDANRAKATSMLLAIQSEQGANAADESVRVKSEPLAREGQPVLRFFDHSAEDEQAADLSCEEASNSKAQLKRSRAEDEPQAQVKDEANATKSPRH